jgi:hypothetical protein
MELFQKYLAETWAMTSQLAPWLLVGFALAGFISLALRRSLVTRVLGKPGIGSIVKATLVGVPMPLCSCGVIPVAAAIREKGAGKGATAAFLASTPETGIDSAVATWGMLGPVMMVVRIVMAFVTGITAGLLVQFVTRHEKEATPAHEEGHNHAAEPRQSIADALRYAFTTMPRDMAPSLFTGILLAGAVAAFIPADFFARIGVHGILAYVVVTLFAVPLYVCSTGSIPLALAMMQAGFTPGGALVFLISGPATNAATIATMRRYLGTRAIVAYLAAIIGTAWIAGALIDAGLGKESILAQMPHDMSSPSVIGQICAVILTALMLRGLWARLGIGKRGGKTASCCNHATPATTKAAHSCCCHGAQKATEKTASICCHDKAEPAAESPKPGSCCQSEGDPHK